MLLNHHQIELFSPNLNRNLISSIKHSNGCFGFVFVILAQLLHIRFYLNHTYENGGFSDNSKVFGYLTLAYY